MPQAGKIVIALFNRFGDSIVAAVACREFIDRWSGEPREFVIVTAPHLAPYIQEICPKACVLALQRGNPLSWLRYWFQEKFVFNGFDVGLNPYSFGKESRSVIKKARFVKTYRGSEETFVLNYYDRVRQYLELSLQGDFLNASGAASFASLRRIIVCPESTEKRRSLTQMQLHQLVDQMKLKWPGVCVKIACSAKTEPIFSSIGDVFVLGKSRRHSCQFIDELKLADVVVSVDAGPLHIAMAMNKQVIGLFSSAMPATVIPHGANACALRHSALTDTYCEVKQCSEPRCMNPIVQLNVIAEHPPSSNQRKIVSDSCPCP